MDTVKFNKQKVKMVAHRGVSGLEKENTYAAFVAAGNRSYWGVETDVRMTADGEFIILHDGDVSRVTGGEAKKAEETDLKSLRTLRLLDIDNRAGNEALCLPTLEEYIRVCKKYEKKCVLEIKTHLDEASTARMLEQIRAPGYLEEVTFISFNAQNLIHVRKLCPTAKIQYLFSEVTEEVLSLLQEYRFDVDISYKSLTEELVARFHALGMEVNCWTVDTPAIAEQLALWGVDYITSNILE